MQTTATARLIKEHAARKHTTRPVFACPGCIQERGPMYPNDVDATLNAAAKHAEELVELLLNLSRPNAQIRRAVELAEQIDDALSNLVDP